MHVWRSTSLGTGGRLTAATGGEWAGRTLRGRLPFVFVRGASTPVDGLRGAQSIEVGLRLSICHRGVSGDAEGGEYKAHVRSLSVVAPRRSVRRAAWLTDFKLELKGRSASFTLPLGAVEWSIVSHYEPDLAIHHPDGQECHKL
jgi:hypothetical protein